MGDAGLRAALWRMLAEEQRSLGSALPRSRVVEREGVVASVVPEIPEASLPNAAVPVDHRALTSGLLRELEVIYARAGVRKWGVWVDPSDADALATLSMGELVFDSHPTPMGAPLDDLDLDAGADAPPRATVDLPAAGRVNDLAYGHPDRRLERLIGALPSAVGGVHAVLGDDGEPVSVALVAHHGDNAGVWFVATVPWARHQGHARTVIRRGLREARDRGCRTTTLVASPLGAPVYAAMGYRELGALHLWERRT